MISHKRITTGLPEYPDIRRLMQTAFPQNEQIPFFLLQLLALRGNTSFRAFYDEQQFCGILYTYENDQYVFVLYLAVNDRIRSKGYGTQILQWLKRNTSKVIVLNVESVNPAAENNRQREKRTEFYRRNGITDTEYRFTDDGERYSVLSSDSAKFKIEEYRALLKKFSFGSYSRI